ncbi:hypothetical protein DSM106972_079240 [Dulcicalothrix desertica PCC 7102]|uniref:DUF4058 domain-containing protein n=1 Tax=Dulcicalothrix desertica PCC 7102 TaxID=232991 RepID=A0A433UZF0_9CYAN|nr:DUF4058 family protein [Dulcicalothrix desertica]RUS99222.1 hypothetical protein DSM106972_079240 [Dulcicalothrix desertica PCC 7102]TWH61074.1 uncharacterized protein DUF4058 [Dulcicalothrix desertica PCC 7102]
MPSPLPGMNPYLENPEFWSEFHSRMIVAIADALDDSLSEDYRVAVEKRVYLSDDGDNVLIGIPDVSVTTSLQSTTQIATLEPITQPISIEIPIAEEVQERFLEIREVVTGTVITVIELISPKNKRAGEGRSTYLQKRQKILVSATHLVEIDLLRGGNAFTMGAAFPSDYRIIISRSYLRPKAELYAFNLQQPIPAIPIPLRSGENEPVLDLQSLLHKVYDRARFKLGIDYNKGCTPKLSKESEAWLRSIIL